MDASIARNVSRGLNGPADSIFDHAVLRVSVPELRSGAWQLLSCQVTNDRHRLGKRIIFGRLVYRDVAANRARAVNIVAKVYGAGADDSAASLESLQQLWVTGFRPPARYRVPRPYGRVPKPGTLFLGHAPGTAWADLLQLRDDNRAAAAASARAAAWLIRLQRSSLTGGPIGTENSAQSTRRLTCELTSSFPDYARRLEPLASSLTAQLPSDRVPMVPSHGDYHPRNVFLTAGVTTVIDFDAFGMREPAFDVGYAIGQLLIRSYFHSGDFSRGASAALAFWRRYEDAGQACWQPVAVHVARTFLQSLHFELCALRNHRLELLGLWPDQMAAWLDSSRPTMLEDLVRDEADGGALPCAASTPARSVR